MSHDLDDAIVFSTLAREPAQLHHTPGSLTARPYDSLSQDRWLVAVHCRGTQPDGTPSNFVLWFEPDEASIFARGLGVASHLARTENLRAKRGNPSDS